jgi:hypothetical protein
MTEGDFVVEVADPLNVGKMIVLEVVQGADGPVFKCEAVHPDASGEFAREFFLPHEIELFDVWEKAAA